MEMIRANRIRTEDNSIRIGELYVRRSIKPPESSDKDEVYIGIWNGDSTDVGLDDLKELRRFLNETIMKMTFKSNNKQL